MENNVVNPAFGKRAKVAREDLDLVNNLNNQTQQKKPPIDENPPTNGKQVLTDSKEEGGVE